jgi:hypothetical protein
VWAQRRFNICKEIGVNLTETLASGCIKLVETSGDSKAIILWNQQVKTEGNIHSNKPEITFRYDGKEKY